MTFFTAVRSRRPSIPFLSRTNRRVHNIDTCLDTKANNISSGNTDHQEFSMIHCNNGSTSSVGMPATPNESCCSRTFHRRVCFIDEALGLPEHDVVTRTSYRPLTTAEEKSHLYYTPQDYAFFELEEYHHQLEMTHNSYPSEPWKLLSWEDCIMYDDIDSYHCDSDDDEHAHEEGNAMHKVKSLHDLHI
mmetsp:Transcript_34126/g.71848  ORF Transcript_34126/g.71848 Transcript_34126/m.71848 type:complete len:189 (+) Transcript_34126:248-814(+)